MRLPLLVAVVASATALAAPADAALYPVCGTQLVAAATGASTSCTTGNTPALTHRANRRLDVTAVSGTVDARLTCNNAYVPSTQTLRVVAPGTVTVRVTERIGYSCVATLTAVSDSATAYGLTTYTYVLVDPHPVL